MTRPRHVRGLKKAELMPAGPYPFTPKLKGTAARGISFQRKVHKALVAELSDFGPVLDGPWIRYTDTYGQHWCQLDSAINASDRVIVFESKLSLRRLSTALVQLTKLYRPTVELIFNKPVIMCVAFHHWVPDTQFDLPMVDEPSELLSVPLRQPGPYGWHYL